MTNIKASAEYWTIFKEPAFAEVVVVEEAEVVVSPRLVVVAPLPVLDEDLPEDAEVEVKALEEERELLVFEDEGEFTSIVIS